MCPALRYRIVEPRSLCPIQTCSVRMSVPARSWFVAYVARNLCRNQLLQLGPVRQSLFFLPRHARQLSPVRQAMRFKRFEEVVAHPAGLAREHPRTIRIGRRP